MKTVQTLMLFLLLLGSCNLNREHKQEVINVPLEGRNALYASSFIDSFQIVRLETNGACLISQVTKIKIDGKRIYVLDISSNSLYVFHSDGRFMGKVSQVGVSLSTKLSCMIFEVNHQAVSH